MPLNQNSVGVSYVQDREIVRCCKSSSHVGCMHVLQWIIILGKCRGTTRANGEQRDVVTDLKPVCR